MTNATIARFDPAWHARECTACGMLGMRATALTDSLLIDCATCGAPHCDMHFKEPRIVTGAQILEGGWERANAQ